MNGLDPIEMAQTFEGRLREWSRRPPRTSATVARTRVVVRLPETSRSVAWVRLAAAASLLVVLIVAVWQGSPRPAGPAAASSMAAFVPSLDPNVVVWVVDSRTTVYFVLEKDSSERRGVS